ncbi:MAG: DNA repair protein RadC [Dehalobacterium sp.]
MSYLDLSKAKFEDILALTIREKPDSDVIEEIMSRLKESRNILEITMADLQSIKGIGQRKALTLTAAVELSKRLMTLNQSSKSIIRHPGDVFTLLADMRFLDREHFRVIHLNTKNNIIYIDNVSIGTLSRAIVHPREVFKTAVKMSSASLILVHNHPSGDPSPSKEDNELTARIVDAGKIIGIEVLDHIIIGNGFVSLKEKGLM